MIPTTPLAVDAVATNPDPPPPEDLTRGSEVYPYPELVILTP